MFHEARGGVGRNGEWVIGAKGLPKALSVGRKTRRAASGFLPEIDRAGFEPWLRAGYPWRVDASSID
jgi:hypothetical protein